MTKNEKETDKLNFPDLRKIVNDNIKTIYKNNNKNRFKIPKAITIKNKNLL